MNAPKTNARPRKNSAVDRLMIIGGIDSYIESMGPKELLSRTFAVIRKKLEKRKPLSRLHQELVDGLRPTLLVAHEYV